MNSNLTLPRPFEAIIFDMDGVIVDSEPLHELAFLQVFQDLGCEDSHGVDFPAYYGRSDLTLWQDFVERHRPPHSLAQLLAWKQEKFLKLLDQQRPVFMGIPDLVSVCASRYPVAIASGSVHQVIRAVLELEDLHENFSAVVSAEDVPNGKPAPDIFLRAADLLQKPPERCCVIEDSSAGVHGAIAAGMQAIAITHSLPREQLSHATCVVDSIAELQSLLDRSYSPPV